MNSILKIMLFLFLTGVFLSGTISTIEEGEALTDYILGASCVGIICVYLVNNKNRTQIPLVLSISFLVYIFIVFSASLKNESFQMFLSSWRFLLVFFTLSIIIPNILKEKTFSITIGALFVSQLPLLVMSFIETNPFSDLSSAYLGIFYNSNSFGIFTSTLFTILLALMYKYSQLKERLLQTLVIISLFILFFLTTLSGSRTSTVVILIIILTMISFHLLKHIDFNNISIKKVVTSFITMIGFMALFVWFSNTRYYEVFDNRIIKKFSNQINDGNVLNSRGEIFVTTLREANLFGHGSDYFTQHFSLGAHNTFISILGQYGYLAAFIFILFWIYALYKAIKYYYKSANQYSILPIIVIIFFLATSMTEIMLMKVSMLFAFVAIGVVSIENNYKKPIKTFHRLNTYKF